MKKKFGVIVFLSLIIDLTNHSFAQKGSPDLLHKDSLYTPNRTSPFNIGTRDKYGVKYKSYSKRGVVKNCLKQNVGLLGRGVLSLEYERLIHDSWTAQVGICPTIFRDLTNELWLDEENYYSVKYPESNGFGLHLSGEVRYHFDEAFDDFFFGFGTRYTGYNLKYSRTSTEREVVFTEGNTDIIGTMGWGYSGDSYFYFEMVAGAGYRMVNTINYSYSPYNNNIYSNPEIIPISAQFTRPILLVSIKLGGLF